MLSILIPIYNFDVRPLVRDLYAQMQAIPQASEILLIDDASTPTFQELNKALVDLKGVRYELLEENIGRSKIRNRLAQRAAFEYLLYMDCDSEVVKEDYLIRYIEAIQEGTILYGGRVYAERPPADAMYRLHWMVGKAREEHSADKRSRQAYHSFMTNNYLIPREIQLQFPFEERIRQYGHEDTLFGLQLQKAKIPIVHLDNPLVHIGLEDAATFLKKSRAAIENLVFLAQEYPEMQTKLLRTAKQFKKWKLDGIYRKFIYKTRQGAWQQKLSSPSPDLTLFDLWKLGVLLETI